jgi:hypothetical protein
MHRHHHAITDALIELADQATPVGQRRILEALVDKVQSGDGVEAHSGETRRSGSTPPIPTTPRAAYPASDTVWGEGLEGQADGVR